MTSYSLSHLSDESLASALERSASEDRLTNATLLAHIAEFDRRRLCLPTRYPSMFRYCVGHLRMSKDVAYKRVRVARVARRFPFVFEAIADGRLNLAGVTLLASRLTRANGRELLAAAMNRSRAEILEMLARRFPMNGPSAGPATCSPGAVAPSAAALLVDAESSWGPSAAPVSRMTADSPPDSLQDSLAPGPVEFAGVFAATEPNSLPEPQVRVRPVAPGRYELVAILGQEAYEQLEASRALLGHAIPSGALIEVLERAIALQHEQLRKRRCGAAARPHTGVTGAVEHRSANPRRVPRAVVRAVWERDGDRCAFIGADGHRCEERELLELDHVVPVARGGQATVENLRLLCRAHNQHAAERELGSERMRTRRETAQRARAAEQYHRRKDRERTERRKAEIARQREELGEAFRQLGYRGRSLEIALAYCASRAEAPLEERLRYALGCMAPVARREVTAA
jgi:5-methylcytosine-specific restriction endonuclease McrA